MGTERDQTRPAAGAPGAATAARRPQRGLQPAMAFLAGAIGNRAMGGLLQRQPTATADKILKPTTLAVSREEVEAAEAWVLYMAQRGTSARPTLGYPERYRTFLAALNDAVFGAQDEKVKKPVSDSRFFLKTLRELHDQLIGTKDYRAFDLADLALKRAAANAKHEGGEGAFAETGAT